MDADTMFRAYAQSNLANILFAQELGRRLRSHGSRIPANVVHPGEVLTEVMRDMHPLVRWPYFIISKTIKPLLHLFFKTARQGSSCTVHVATSPDLATSDVVSGAFFMRHQPVRISDIGRDVGVAHTLWHLSERITNAPPILAKNLHR